MICFLSLLLIHTLLKIFRLHQECQVNYRSTSIQWNKPQRRRVISHYQKQNSQVEVTQTSQRELNQSQICLIARWQNWACVLSLKESIQGAALAKLSTPWNIPLRPISTKEYQSSLLIIIVVKLASTYRLVKNKTITSWCVKSFITSSQSSTRSGFPSQLSSRLGASRAETKTPKLRVMVSAIAAPLVKSHYRRQRERP